MNVFYHSLHIELWDWLIANPTKDKYEWPRWEEIGEVYNLCFACDYAANASSGFRCAVNCPFDGIQRSYNCLNGLYHRWEELQYVQLDEEVLRKKVELAKKIRDFPVKEEVICK